MQKSSDFLSQYDNEYLNNLASGIADYYFPTGRVEPELIAIKNNISFSYGEYGDSFDGLIQCEEDLFHIYVNTDRLTHGYSDRARFTFAHELGHYFIDDHRNALLEGKSPSHSSITGFVRKNRAERQADYFASSLLLPEFRFKLFCERKKFDFKIIQDLSKIFGVSLSATALRFCSIGNHPIMVVYSNDMNIKWYWYSGDFPFKGLKYGMDRLPEDTVAGEYFKLQRSPKSKQSLFAMDWFNIWQDNQAELPFYEQCIFSGKHCLSVIWED